MNRMIDAADAPPAPERGSTAGSTAGLIDWIGTQVAAIIPDPEEIRARAPIFAPMLFVLIANITAAASLQPIVNVGLSGTSPATEESVGTWLWLAAGASPVLALVKALMLGALAWACLVLAGRDAPYRTLLSANMYGQSVLALSALLPVIVLRIRGAAAVRSPQDLLVPQGLDYFIDPDGSPLRMSLLQQTSVFHLLWIVFMIWVLPRSAGLSIRSSIAVSLLLTFAGVLTALVKGIALS